MQSLMNTDNVDQAAERSVEEERVKIAHVGEQNRRIIE